MMAVDGLARAIEIGDFNEPYALMLKRSIVSAPCGCVIPQK